jgi:L-2-hydroxyglutarate oxidase LhgO
VEQVGIAIVGAGVVGLAVAERLSRRTESLVVLERHESFGRETSSRNSEVIHAGLYYDASLFKTRLCVRGNAMLYELCVRHLIPHRRTGKIIVATSEAEVAKLERIRGQALANGAEGISMLSDREVAALEPEVSSIAGLLSPASGIVDSHALMAYLEQEARARGAVLAYGCRVEGVERAAGGYRLAVRDADGAPLELQAEALVNSAGLDADRLAAAAGIDIAAAGYRIHPCKGEYFSLSGRWRGAFRRLVYPVPSPIHLGAHVVLGLDGRTRVGPNAFYVGEIEYSVDSGHRGAFHVEARKFLPGLQLEDLAPDMAGIRPKLYGGGEPFRDFVIREESGRGLPGLVNLVGIESPGLTSCLAIAEEVEGLLGFV